MTNPTDKRSAMPAGGAPSTLWTAAREKNRARRTARASLKSLERELGTYRTASERMELDAIMARHDPAQVSTIAAIIDRQRVA